MPSEILCLTRYIGSGNGRICWHHPHDAALCVKVARPDSERPQNAIDWHYSRVLRRRGISGPHIAQVYSWAETDKGPGLVVELVADADGTPSQPLFAAIQSGNLDVDTARCIVDEAFAWLKQHRVLYADHSADNMLVRKLADGSCQLVFVDGLGARNMDIHYWINRHLPFKSLRKAEEFRLMTHQRMPSGPHIKQVHSNKLGKQDQSAG